ncbi:MAG: response regulator transcription factor [Gammaproteobacteria bacterium]|nr:response regulator transcription factor [Gammaproteobacteria bacterium]
MSTSKRILIADDHGIMRDGLSALLAQEQNLEVVGLASNGREAIRAAEQLKPDLIIMDVSMPLTNGQEAIAHIKKRTPEVRVLVLTFHSDDNNIYHALRSGADGYVLKDDSRVELLNAIRVVLSGKSYLSPAICDRVVSGYLGGGKGVDDGPRADTGPGSLTTREREILKLVAEGHRTRQIAKFLSLSPKTVEKHRSNMMRKLNLKSAAAVTSYAIVNGFVRT